MIAHLRLHLFRVLSTLSACDALVSRGHRFRRHARRALFFAVITTFLRAVTHSAFLLRRLQEREWGVALRTRLGNGLVPEDHIAFGIFRAAVESFSALRFLDDNLAFASSARASDARRFALDVIALWIVGTRDKLAKASEPPNQVCPVNRAFFVQLHGGGRNQPCSRPERQRRSDLFLPGWQRHAHADRASYLH